MMELNSLRQFLVVARLEHLSRAADELHIAQPSLSRTIARLESELGVPLFDRGGRLRLNDTGRLYRDHVERALGELDAGRRAVTDAADQGLGTVRLASETFLTLTGPLAAFKRTHPDAEIALHWSPPEDMARRLRAQDIDLCVTSHPIHTEGLEATRLFQEQVGAAFPLDHPLAGRTSVTISDLADQPFVTARNEHWLRRLLDRLFAAHGLTPKIVCESDEHSAIADLISAGLGTGLVPASARRSTTRAPLAWIPLDDPASHRTVTLYQATNSHPSTATHLMHTTITNWNWTTNQPPTH
ncbi:LysR substrate-binding domain-containing protein [Streptomyces sp. NPDC059010]|uniref:LysR substrate-binding domain-containing protein n=1 Tax=Streptomyces sp. NPDC059010 TaxID=3346695 RepID=UPI0036753A82